jgi:predicted dehydrogenase
MAHSDGMNYAPRGKVNHVCKPGEFRFSVIGLDHGHILGMTSGLQDAGGELVQVYDPDPAKVEAFRKQFPTAAAARTEMEVLEDSTTQMVASAAVPADRGSLGLRVLDAGKHYLSDKAPFTTLEQLEAARRAVAARVPDAAPGRTPGTASGRTPAAAAAPASAPPKWAVCYSERVQNEAAVKAGELIKAGAIGRVLQVIGMGPHRLNAPSRPPWFFQRERYGGILIDLGSHQIEQFLSYAGAANATVVHSKRANYSHTHLGDFDDFGDATLVADNGATCYFRVDWFTPDGLSTWGDGRTFILGTDGYIELRKYVDVARDQTGDHLYLVDHTGERHIPVHGTVGFPYFGQLIRDCLDGTDHAMPQDHTFLAAELCIRAQEQATSIGI